MKKYWPIAVLLVMALAITEAVLLPRTTPATAEITLPVARMLACPVGDPAVGKTVVTVADQATFTAGEAGALAGEPTTYASFENPAKPIIVRGSSMVSGLTVYTEGDKSASIPCAAPVTAGTWNGITTPEGAAVTLYLSNVDPGPAVVDVFLVGQTGPVAAAGLSDIPVASGATRTLAIDQIVTSETPFSVQIRASKGRVSATLRVIGPTGLDWQLPQTSADTDIVIAGIPAGEGTRTLTLTNADQVNRAHVAVTVLTETGTFDAIGLDSLEVPAGRAESIDITEGLAAQATALHLVSDLPITATVVTSAPDLAGVSAYPALAGAVVFPPVGGTLWAANPGTTAATVSLRATDDTGTVASSDTPVNPGSLVGIPFPSAGKAVRVWADSDSVRTAVVT
ncbi:MAG: DUF5719 family protein, partial [Propionibacteriaceae bacterium]|nr:DUF5719 family protein [Propionibacteriaceae bacterium]